MADPLFSGVGVALVTLFDDDGGLDTAATADLAVRLVEAGLKAVVVSGSTGEAAALSADERNQLVRAVREAVPSTVPVLAGTGAASARQAIAFTRGAIDHGADGVLTLSPPGTADPTRYYEAVAGAAGDVAVLAYHFPRTSAPGVPVRLLPNLPVKGIKDSSGDADRLLETLETWDRATYTGSSALLALAGPLGCAGAILALANAEPELCVAAFEGDAGAQRKLAASHLASRAPFPGAIKDLTARRFNTSTTARMGI